MNIVHIAPNAVFTDGWTYQENLLPKYQMKLGYNVTLLVWNMAWIEGKATEVECTDYICKDGFRVIRLKRMSPFSGRFVNMFSYIEIYKYLLELQPDMVFFHGMVSATIYQVVKYKKTKNKDMIIVQDNHLDYNIGKIKNPFNEKLFNSIYKIYYKTTGKYINRVYGVTPWRKKYAIEVYGVPEEKADVLIMGADDEKIDFSHRDTIKKEIRIKYNIPEDAFLIVSGGKIDVNKNIHILMESISNLKNVYLLIFGNIYDDVKDIFNLLLSSNDRIKYVGWIPGEKIYDYFFASDLVCFPGQHSVLWEQACASKVPCLFKYWEGMDHVNNGGNAGFIDIVDSKTLENTISNLVFTNHFFEMKRVAESEKTDIYLYSGIAQKSVELLKNE